MTKTPSKPPAAVPTKVGSERVAQYVERARRTFEDQSRRFTGLRERVFAEIAATPGSIGAYEILDRLAQKGTRLAPISIYRSIDALLEAGVIHRLESKNAYFACRRHEHEHTKGGRPIFLVCERCGSVGEVPAQPVFDHINAVAREAGFDPKVKFVEVSGLCGKCAKRSK